MPRSRRTPEQLFARNVALLRQAGLTATPGLRQLGPPNTAEITDLPTRIAVFTRLLREQLPFTRPADMLFLVLYDIEHNRIRTHVARYLLRKGCYRIQKSVFIGRLPRATYDEIHATLRDVQTAYDNHDSIMLVPIGQDELRALRLLGQAVDMDLLTGRRNVLVV